jgi:hypothetical protein
MTGTSKAPVNDGKETKGTNCLKRIQNNHLKEVQ